MWGEVGFLVSLGSGRARRREISKFISLRGSPPHYRPDIHKIPWKKSGLSTHTFEAKLAVFSAFVRIGTHKERSLGQPCIERDWRLTLKWGGGWSAHSRTFVWQSVLRRRRATIITDDFPPIPRSGTSSRSKPHSWMASVPKPPIDSLSLVSTVDQATTLDRSNARLAKIKTQCPKSNLHSD